MGFRVFSVGHAKEIDLIPNGIEGTFTEIKNFIKITNLSALFKKPFVAL